MKTATEVLTDELNKLPTRLKGEVVRWDKLIDDAIIKAMVEYGKLVVDRCADEGHRAWGCDINY